MGWRGLKEAKRPISYLKKTFTENVYNNQKKERNQFSKGINNNVITGKGT